MQFELPPGDPDAIDSALAGWTGVAGDLGTQVGKAKSGFAAALETWKGPRADTFRSASGGLQLQVSEASSAMQEAIPTVQAYAKALRHARDEIARLSRQATARQHQVDDETRNQDPDSIQVLQAEQHCAQFIGGLEAQAAELRRQVKVAAQAAAATLGSATTPACPGAERLTPEEIARKVHTTTGVDGIQGDIDSGRLTADDAWRALSSSESELGAGEIEKDGSIDWEKVQEQIEHLAEQDGKLQDDWTLATAPTAGWALARLGLAARQRQVAEKLFDAAIKPLIPEWARPGVDLDAAGEAGSLDDVMSSVVKRMHWSADEEAAINAFTDAAASGEQLDASKLSLMRNGLPPWAELGVDAVGVLGYLGDAYMVFAPGQSLDDRIDGGLNALGLGMLKTGKPIVEAASKVLGFGGEAAEVAEGTELAVGGTELLATGGELAGVAALDASVGWVPVVGWALVAGTAGYEVYKHWDEIQEGATEAVHWVGDEGSKAVHAVGDAASSVSHFVSDHVPHVHLW
jgi:hypothetical protein